VRRENVREREKVTVEGMRATLVEKHE